MEFFFSFFGKWHFVKTLLEFLKDGNTIVVSFILVINIIIEVFFLKKEQNI